MLYNRKCVSNRADGQSVHLTVNEFELMARKTKKNTLISIEQRKLARNSGCTLLHIQTSTHSQNNVDTQKPDERISQMRFSLSMFRNAHTHKYSRSNSIDNRVWNAGQMKMHRKKLNTQCNRVYDEECHNIVSEAKMSYGNAKLHLTH